MSFDPTKRSAERPLQEPDVQAEAFAQVRQAHQMESTEDYVELIDDLINSQGEARLVEVAERLGISQPSAGKTIARLQREGYVTSEPYRSIFLTEKGKNLADYSRERHDVVYRFLLAIGVSDATAKIDSEGVEHHVSEETLDAFRRIIDASGSRGSLGDSHFSTS
jgi:DtxR family manganese transport transcriptional regulator